MSTPSLQSPSVIVTPPTQSLRQRLDQLQQSTPKTESLSIPSAMTSPATSPQMLVRNPMAALVAMQTYNQIALSLTQAASLVNELFNNIEKIDDQSLLLHHLTEALISQQKTVDALSSVKSLIPTSEISKSAPDSTQETVSSGTMSKQ